MLFGVLAYMIGAAATPFVVGLFASKREGYAVVGIIYGALAAIGLWVAAAGIRERSSAGQPGSETSPMRSFRWAFQNRPFLRLVFAYLIAQVGFTLVQTLMAYFLTYQMGIPGQVPVVMLLLLVSVLVFLFPWKWLSDRWNKGPAYALGLGIASLALVATFFLPHHASPWIYVVAVVAGIGFSANWVFPWSMVPDVVEYDQLETGEARGGMYYGVWGFTSKLTAALAITISGWVLQLGGYVPNIEQSSRTLLAIRLFFGPVPSLFLLIALPLLFFYPITRASHAQVLRRLAERKA
jgi:GPH family glycoside/pentoside/hexuronide:cation symporter